MFAAAEGMERRAREALVDARELYRRSAQAGSVDADLALVRLAAEDRDYGQCRWQIDDIRRRYPDLDAARLVTVAPGILGSRMSYDGESFVDFNGAFVAISPDLERAAAAMARVAPQLLHINERGEVQSEDAVDGLVPGEELYTPNFVSGVVWCRYGAMVALDTKGSMWPAMGRKMVSMLVDELVADAVPAHLTGALIDVAENQWRDWEPSEG